MNALVNRPRVLLVDDEPAVLEGLELQLGRRFEVHTAGSGAEGLQRLQSPASYAVIISDMRMPGMDGAAFLAQARKVAPLTVRMLLTGYADTPSAVSAINDGEVFRFLTKPCAPALLQAAMDAAVRQHQLLTAEKELIENTLRGAVRALTEILAISDAGAYAEAQRVQRLALDLAAAAAFEPLWSLEMAAQLDPIGNVSLPADVQRRMLSGTPLSDEEEPMVKALPRVTDRLLAPIPRLEPVRAILLLRHGQPLPREWDELFSQDQLAGLRRAASILRLSADYESHIRRGYGTPETIGALRAQASREEQDLVELLVATHARDAAALEVRSVASSRLRPGMVIAEDVYTSAGQLLIGRGYTVSEGFLARIANIRRGLIREPVQVILPAASKAA